MSEWESVVLWYDRSKFRIRTAIDKIKIVVDRRVPIVGRLVYCDFDDHWNTLSDVLNYVVWATMPFWLGALVLLLTDSSATKDFGLYWQFLISTFNKGELLIFSTALLAPAFSAALIDPKAKDVLPFPGKLSHATIVAILMVICAALYSVQRINHDVDPELLFRLSVIASIISFCFFYLGSLYNHNRSPDASGEIRRDEGAFSDLYDTHREIL